MNKDPVKFAIALSRQMLLPSSVHSLFITADGHKNHKFNKYRTQNCWCNKG